MFEKVLIANCGAIACRIIRTLPRMGVGSVTVHRTADMLSRHVLEVDEVHSTCRISSDSPWKAKYGGVEASEVK